MLLFIKGLLNGSLWIELGPRSSTSFLVITGYLGRRSDGGNVALQNDLVLRPRLSPWASTHLPADSDVSQQFLVPLPRYLQDDRRYSSHV
jgi:hypothetical protein